MLIFFQDKIVFCGVYQWWVPHKPSGQRREVRLGLLFLLCNFVMLTHGAYFNCYAEISHPAYGLEQHIFVLLSDELYSQIYLLYLSLAQAFTHARCNCWYLSFASECACSQEKARAEFFAEIRSQSRTLSDVKADEKQGKIPRQLTERFPNFFSMSTKDLARKK